MFYGGGAIVVRKQNKLVELFNRYGAINPENAISIEDIGVRNNFIFYRMAKRNIFVQVEDGKFYIDNVQFARFKENRRKKVLFFAFLILLAFALYSLNIFK